VYISKQEKKVNMINVFAKDEKSLYSNTLDHCKLPTEAAFGEHPPDITQEQKQ